MGIRQRAKDHKGGKNMVKSIRQQKKAGRKSVTSLRQQKKAGRKLLKKHQKLGTTLKIK